jgi:hypothetical protein
MRQSSASCNSRNGETRLFNGVQSQKTLSAGVSGIHRVRMFHFSEMKKSMISERQLYGMAANYVKIYEHCIQNYSILGSVSL